MKRIMLLAVLLLLVPWGGAAAQQQASQCPSNATGWWSEPFAGLSNDGGVGMPLTLVYQEYGYSVVWDVPTDPNDRTTCTLYTFLDRLDNNYGGIVVMTHGSGGIEGYGAGLAVEAADTTDAGLEYILDRIVLYMEAGWDGDGIWLGYTDDGWCVVLTPDSLAGRYQGHSRNSHVYVGACESNTIIWPGARVQAGYEHVEFATARWTDVSNYALSMGGGNGPDNRTVVAALTGNLTIVAGGFTNTTIAPGVCGFTYNLGEVDAQYLCEIDFDTEMQMSSLGSLLSTDGCTTCQISNARWVGNAQITFTLTTECAANVFCTVHVIAGLAASAQGGHYLDGNGQKPNGDDFVVEMDPSLVVNFGRFGAYRAGGTVHAYWLARREMTSGYRIFGDAEQRNVLASVPSKGSGRHFYDVAVPGNPEVLQVVEIAEGPFPDATRPFRVAAERPADYGTLVAQDGMETNCEPGCQDSCLALNCDPPPPPPDTLLTDFVFLGPTTLTGSADSMITWWAAQGKTSQKLSVASGSSASYIRGKLRPIWQKWVNHGAVGTPPIAMLVGMGSILNPWRYVDAIETRVSYTWLMDFDNDGWPDMPFGPVPAGTSAEANTFRDNALWWCRNVWETNAPQRSFAIAGDIPGPYCDVLSLTLRTATEDAAAENEQRGITTALRYDSAYDSCFGYAERLLDGVAVVNNGITQMEGPGWTDFETGPAWMFQLNTPPFFDVTMLTKKQALVGIFPTCGMGNADSVGIARLLLTQNANVRTAAAAWVGPFGSGDELAEVAFYANLRTAMADPASWCFPVAVWKAMRMTWDMSTDGDWRELVQTLVPSGFPIPIAGNAVTGIGDHPMTAARTGLLFAGPVPSRTGVSILYRLAAPGFVDLRIYDASGRLVVTPVPPSSTLRQPGVVTVQWDGRDALGRTVPSGVYFCHLNVAGISDVRRLVLAR